MNDDNDETHIDDVLQRDREDTPQHMGCLQRLISPYRARFQRSNMGDGWKYWSSGKDDELRFRWRPLRVRYLLAIIVRQGKISM